MGKTQFYFNSKMVSFLMTTKEDFTGLDSLLNEIIFQYLDPHKKAE